MPPTTTPPTTTPLLPPVNIAIMAKAPIAGLAKTRLIPHLGEVGAAALQDWLLQRALNTSLNSTLSASIGAVTVWATPSIDHPAFVRARTAGSLPYAIATQINGDLGTRMHHAMAHSVDTSSTLVPTLVIGTDCPLLTPARLQEAAQTLNDYDIVTIPAEDGGYVLIGMRHVNAHVFTHIDWSTEHVMRQTRAQWTALQWRGLELPPLWDVDRAEDFERLAMIFPEVRAFQPESSHPSPSIMPT